MASRMAVPAPPPGPSRPRWDSFRPSARAPINCAPPGFGAARRSSFYTVARLFWSRQTPLALRFVAPRGCHTQSCARTLGIRCSNPLMSPADRQASRPQHRTRWCSSFVELWGRLFSTRYSPNFAPLRRFNRAVGIPVSRAHWLFCLKFLGVICALLFVFDLALRAALRVDLLSRMLDAIRALSVGNALGVGSLLALVWIAARLEATRHAARLDREERRAQHQEIRADLRAIVARIDTVVGADRRSSRPG